MLVHHSLELPVRAHGLGEPHLSSAPEYASKSAGEMTGIRGRRWSRMRTDDGGESSRAANVAPRLSLPVPEHAQLGTSEQETGGFDSQTRRRGIKENAEGEDGWEMRGRDGMRRPMRMPIQENRSTGRGKKEGGTTRGRMDGVRRCRARVAADVSPKTSRASPTRRQSARRRASSWTSQLQVPQKRPSVRRMCSVRRVRQPHSTHYIAKFRPNHANAGDATQSHPQKKMMENRRRRRGMKRRRAKARKRRTTRLVQPLSGVGPKIVRRIMKKRERRIAKYGREIETQRDQMKWKGESRNGEIKGAVEKKKGNKANRDSQGSNTKHPHKITPYTLYFVDALSGGVQEFASEVKKGSAEKEVHRACYVCGEGGEGGSMKGGGASVWSGRTRRGRRRRRVKGRRQQGALVCEKEARGEASPWRVQGEVVVFHYREGRDPASHQYLMLSENRRSEEAKTGFAETKSTSINNTYRDVNAHSDGLRHRKLHAHPQYCSP
ncbi:hypothetical protein C8J57DRAFT_1241764 [Mycena rebaudengoi]|nr:hypothetical protein C8J57DRAFT_1241764 [Mycena rebaudengoi]